MLGTFIPISSTHKLWTKATEIACCYDRACKRFNCRTLGSPTRVGL